MMGSTAEEAAREILSKYGAKNIKYSLSPPIDNGNNFIFGEKIKYEIRSETNTPKGYVSVKRFFGGWQLDGTNTTIGLVEIQPCTDPIEAFQTKKKEWN